MISKYRHRGLTWVDLTSPTEEEISYAFDEYSIPEFIRQEIRKDSKEHYITLENEIIFAILRPNKEENKEKVIFIKDKNFVITIHDQPIHSIEDFSSELELDISFEQDSKIKDHDLLFAHLLRKIYLGFYDKVLDNENVIEKLERKIAKKNKRLKFFAVYNIVSFIIILILIIYAVYNI